MTDEASKTRAVRPADFQEKFLNGRVIDIGCGADPIIPSAEPFDREHGDAQLIASLRPVGAYDAVCSSHCLEHMRDVPGALEQWWALLKAGGFLILVVPDEDLYEQGTWPSVFNLDHKATFRIGKVSSWSKVSYDILGLVQNLKHAEIICCERQDQGYDYSKMKSHLSNSDRFLFKMQRHVKAVTRRLGACGSRLENTVDKVFGSLGVPVDQTSGNALAQIQIIARKSPSSRQ